MARNVEWKARVGDLAALERRVAALADAGPEVLEQEDTFFRARRGRLKLRRSGGSGELIHYERADLATLKESHYRVAPVAAPELLRELLADALGVRGVVRKTRILYRVGAARVHLDRVEGLGEFVELELVLAPDEAAGAGERLALELMAKLGIRPEQLVAHAYVDALGAAPDE